MTKKDQKPINENTTILSERQLLFRDYLIKKLGFVQDEFLHAYLDELHIAAPSFSMIGAIKEEWETVDTEDGTKVSRLKNSDDYKTYVSKMGVMVPSNFNIIDFLNHEYKIKKSLLAIPKTKQSNYISATDIATFTFCPVSFSIARSFDMPKIETAITGSDLHESRRLINYVSSGSGPVSVDYIPESNFFHAEKNKSFFDDVKNSKVLYFGHSTEGRNHYFKSKKGDFVGQPDYVLQNSKGEVFVVEEKFQYQSMYVQNSETENFKTSHINQLVSYLHGISDFNIKYGYLVYWKYGYENGRIEIFSCHVRKIIAGEATRNHIIKVYRELKKLISEKIIDYDLTKRYPKKCANCVANILCGHKTGKFNALKYPYSPEYFKTHYVEFPKELRHDYTPEQPSSDLPLDNLPF